MRIFAAITKVDQEKREVWGRATQEVRDRAKEIFDYDSSAPFFREWSAGFDKATNGQSLGNIRAMHGKVAAGKVINIDFNDTDKAIDIGTKIVDDAEWQKCQEGVYTGFSIGGDYEKRWDDPTDSTLKRFTARPSEISLVDLPCVPTAMFQMVKAAGVVEEIPFKVANDETVIATVADEPTEKIAEPPAGKAADAPVKKSMYGVSELASMLQSMQYIAENAEWEKSWEQDDSPVPAQLRAWVALGAEILVAMTKEETDELVASLKQPDEIEVVELAAKTGDLKKKGARNSAADQDKINAIHDHSVALGADCSASKAAGPDDLQKVISAANLTELGKATALATGKTPPAVLGPDSIDAIAKYALTISGERDELQKRVTELEKQPAPAKGALKAVEKGDDVLKNGDDKPVDPKDSLALMKQAHSQPKMIKLS